MNSGLHNEIFVSAKGKNHTVELIARGRIMIFKVATMNVT